ncbi:MAG: DUF1836 domain-containing protein [Clostridiales bacterium]|jgi:DNA-binding transcriptional MerR regulator|nr:DUF1836 domain-containing protein [Clostridiales bacterium]
MYDPLNDIQHYGKNLTIAQVVKFFEKKELGVTRAMIQNYIRDGLLPPPVNKRFYTHKHLAALVVIDYAKTVFGIGEVKVALTPLMDGEGLPLEIYSRLIGDLASVSLRWKETVGTNIFKTESEKTFSALLLMAHAADLKALAGTMIE